MVGPRTESSGRCTGSTRCGSPISATSSSAHFGRDAKGGKTARRAAAARHRLRRRHFERADGAARGRRRRARSVRDEHRGCAAARRSKAASPSTIAPTTAEELAAAGETFDVVLAMEVVEHVADVARLHRRRGDAAEARRPALRRHHQPHAEGLRARHRRRRISPALAAARHARLREAGAAGRNCEAALDRRRPCDPSTRPALRYNPLTDRWSRSTDMDVNYMMVASKARADRADGGCLAARIAPRRLCRSRFAGRHPFAFSGPMTSSSETAPVGRWAAFQNARLHEILAVAARLELRRADPDRRGRLAGLRPDPRSARPRPRRAVAVPAGAAPGAGHRSGRRPFSPPHDHGGLHRHRGALRRRAARLHGDRAAQRVWPIFVVLVVFGTARAFYGPAQQSLRAEPRAAADAVAAPSRSTRSAGRSPPSSGRWRAACSTASSPEAAYGTARAAP